MKTFRAVVNQHFSERCTLSEVLVRMTKFDPHLLADAAAKGAVWLQKNGKGKILRVRSASTNLSPHDVVFFYYDQKVLSIPELQDADCLRETKNYGIWYKPAGVVTQGTQTGDHSSLFRLIEKKKKKEVYLVHRLDRETAGLMIIGYTQDGARHFGRLFQENKIIKTYEAIILGNLPVGHKQTIDQNLDTKTAITHIEVLDSNQEKSLVKVKIDTGRLHQIRRHLDLIGHPIIGDPKYGKGNKNRQGLQLLARSLKFDDPWEKNQIQVALPEGLSIQ